MTKVRVLMVLGAVAFALSFSLSLGQTTPGQSPHTAHAATPPDETKSLQDQVTELRAQIAKLQAVLQQTGPGKSSGMKMGAGGKSGGMGMGMKGMEGMGMMGEMGGMGMMGEMPGAAGGGSMPPMGQMMGKMGQMMEHMGGMMGMMGDMGSMPKAEGGSMPQMGQMKGEMGEVGGMGSMPSGSGSMPGMAMTGPMGAARGMAMSSALPGVPGASHIYHVGSTGFFLDHQQHIRLTSEQQSALNRLKESSQLEQATAKRKIDEAEQELWSLTGSDQPDAAKIQAKLGEIEKLRADQRIAFIRAVGEAAKVLSEEQRQTLLGKTAPTAGKKAPSTTGK